MHRVFEGNERGKQILRKKWSNQASRGDVPGNRRLAGPLCISALIGRYRGAGSAAYHGAMLLALLIYGYATGTYSSRRIEQATYDSLAFAT
jgi:transposase-like protein DUF772